jgi:hypothetical protein
MDTCANCGAPVTKRFARVYGDNDDTVYGCRSCMQQNEIDRGWAAHPEPEARRVEAVPLGGVGAGAASGETDVDVESG